MQQQIRHSGPGREGTRLDRVRLNEAVTHVVFSGRRRRVYARIAALSGARPEDRVLDIGCGGGYLAGLLAATVGPAGRVTGVDPSGTAISQRRWLLQVTGSTTLAAGEAGHEPAS
jgi:ubiquinone/menaquinone biosynthesis C-methylase UbiE